MLFWQNFSKFAKNGIDFVVSAEPTNPPADKMQVEAFVARMYDLVLGRPAWADPQSKMWVDHLMSGVATASDIAEGIVLSPEFTEMKLTNRQRAEAMYATLLDRKADADGLHTWVKNLDNGMSVAPLGYGFTQSEEF